MPCGGQSMPVAAQETNGAIARKREIDDGEAPEVEFPHGIPGIYEVGVITTRASRA